MVPPWSQQGPKIFHGFFDCRPEMVPETPPDLEHHFHETGALETYTNVLVPLFLPKAAKFDTCQRGGGFADLLHGGYHKLSTKR